MKCKKSKKNESESVGSEDNTPTLRIHFGRGNKATAAGGAIVSALASAAANGGTRLHESIRLSRPPLTSTNISPNSSKPWLRQVRNVFKVFKN